eukprot:s661_g20.t1
MFFFFLVQTFHIKDISRHSMQYSHATLCINFQQTLLNLLCTSSEMDFMEAERMRHAPRMMVETAPTLDSKASRDKTAALRASPAGSLCEAISSRNQWDPQLPAARHSAHGTDVES